MREKKELEEHKKFEKMRLQYEKRGRRRSVRLVENAGTNAADDADACAETQKASGQNQRQIAAKFTYEKKRTTLDLI